MSNGVHLGTCAGLEERQARGFDPLRTGQDSVFVVRKDGRLHAWRDACPHHGGTPMAWRKDAYLNADGSVIVCAAHGAQFDIQSGVCILGPCLGQSLQPVSITITADDDLYMIDPPSI